MKNRLLITGIWALVLAWGMTVVGCDTDDVTGGNNSGKTGDNGNNGENDYDEDLPLPLSSGVNAVSGKTYFQNDTSKIVFSVTASGAVNGTYNRSTVANGTYGHGSKYNYIDIETGAYSWNEGAKTVTLKASGIVVPWGGRSRGDGGEEIWEYTFDPIREKTSYRSLLQDMFNSDKEEIGEEAFNQKLSSMGFSSMADYVNFYVNAVFSNRTYGYSFSTDGAALFLEQALPANKGTNELLLEQSYEGYKGTYLFTAGYTYTYTVDNETGSYACDSNRKWVWIKTEKIGGKDMAGYYTDTTVPYSGHNLIDDSAYKAMATNIRFGLQYYSYNSTNKTIRD
jgi:hypothetical protein